MINKLLLQYRQMLSRQEIFAALLGSFFVIIFATASATLIFTGPLYPFLPIGISAALIGSAVLCLATALKSQFHFGIAWPHAIQAAIMALILANILRETTAIDLYPTMLATIIISSLVTGIIIFSIGYFRLSHFVRFMPYPVIGGFTAGSGWLIVVGALKMMAEVPITFKSLFQPAMWVFYLPGICFGLLLLFLIKRYKSFYILPFLLTIAIPLTYIVMWLLHTSVSQAEQYGWLFPRIPEHLPWHALRSSSWADIDWKSMVSQFTYLITMIAIIVILQLLDVSALEVAIDKRVDFDRELKISGVANIITACLMGLAANIRFSGSYLTYTIGARKNICGIVVAIVCVALLVSGFNILDYLPKLVVTGLLFYFGLNILYQWTVETIKILPLSDYAVIIIILVAVMIWGILQGIAVGLLVSFLFFIVKYSKIPYLKYIVTGETHQSTCHYPLQLERYLHQHGEQIVLFKLQGFIFFGTATSLVDIIDELIQKNKDIRFLILDFQFVPSIDSSASYSFRYIKRVAVDKNIQLIFCQCNASVQKLFIAIGVLQDSSNVIMEFIDADHAVEWCELQIFQQNHLQISFQEKVSLNKLLGDLLRINNI